MSEELSGFADDDVDRIGRMLAAFESGRLERDNRPYPTPVSPPIWTRLGRTINGIPGATPELITGVDIECKLYGLVEQSVDSDADGVNDFQMTFTEITVTAHNPSVVPIRRGSWVELYRDPDSGEWLAMPYLPKIDILMSSGREAAGTGAIPDTVQVTLPAQAGDDRIGSLIIGVLIKTYGGLANPAGWVTLTEFADLDSPTDTFISVVYYIRKDTTTEVFDSWPAGPAVGALGSMFYWLIAIPYHAAPQVYSYADAVAGTTLTAASLDVPSEPATLLLIAGGPNLDPTYHVIPPVGMNEQQAWEPLTEFGFYTESRLRGPTGTRAITFTDGMSAFRPGYAIMVSCPTDPAARDWESISGRPTTLAGYGVTVVSGGTW